MPLSQLLQQQAQLTYFTVEQLKKNVPNEIAALYKKYQNANPDGTEVRIKDKHNEAILPVCHQLMKWSENLVNKGCFNTGSIANTKDISYQKNVFQLRIASELLRIVQQLPLQGPFNPKDPQFDAVKQQLAQLEVYTHLFCSRKETNNLELNLIMDNLRILLAAPCSDSLLVQDTYGSIMDKLIQQREGKKGLDDLAYALHFLEFMKVTDRTQAAGWANDAPSSHTGKYKTKAKNLADKIKTLGQDNRYFLGANALTTERENYLPQVYAVVKGLIQDHPMCEAYQAKMQTNNSNWTFATHFQHIESDPSFARKRSVELEPAPQHVNAVVSTAASSSSSASSSTRSSTSTATPILNATNLNFGMNISFADLHKQFAPPTHITNQMS